MKEQQEAILDRARQAGESVSALPASDRVIHPLKPAKILYAKASHPCEIQRSKQCLVYALQSRFQKTVPTDAEGRAGAGCAP